MEYEVRLKGDALDFSSVATVTECKEMMDKKEGYVTLITYNGDSDLIQYQWMYEAGQEVYAKVWNEDGIEHKKMGDTEFVVVRNAKILQVYIENQNYHNPQKNWSVIVYDMETDKVIATLDYDE